MAVKIDRKIIKYNVASPKSEQIEEKKDDNPEVAEIIHMHESLKRPELLSGSTYKLKPPEHVSDHTLYITINDIVLNPGTEHELRRPFEVFINSKNMDHFQWIVALTRIASAVFRKGGDVTFLVEEFRSVFDPRGGYWNKGKYVPSLVAEIGDVIEKHLIYIGMLKAPELDEHQKKLIDAKREEFELTSPPSSEEESGDFPNSAVMCKKCYVKAAMLLDGCMTCLSCGDSKCG